MKTLNLNQMEAVQGGIWINCNEMLYQLTGMCIVTGYDPCRIPGIYCIM